MIESLKEPAWIHVAGVSNTMNKAICQQKSPPTQWMLFEKQTGAADQVIRLIGNIQSVHKTPTDNNAPQVGVH